jgi:hypothetical protein
MMNKILSTGLLILLFTSVTASAETYSGWEVGNERDRDRDRPHPFPYPEFKDFFRLDCRFHVQDHNTRGSDDGRDCDDDCGRRDCHDHCKKHKPKFCYASAVYKVEGTRLGDIHLGIGCDNETIFYDKARLHIETTLDRLSPFRAATPAVEVFPQGQLTTTGTYTSVLDIAKGRFKGLCYVHKADFPMF